MFAVLISHLARVLRLKEREEAQFMRQTPDLDFLPRFGLPSLHLFVALPAYKRERKSNRIKSQKRKPQ